MTTPLNNTLSIEKYGKIRSFSTYHGKFLSYECYLDSFRYTESRSTSQNFFHYTKIHTLIFDDNNDLTKFKITETGAIDCTKMPKLFDSLLFQKFNPQLAFGKTVTFIFHTNKTGTHTPDIYAVFCHDTKKFLYTNPILPTSNIGCLTVIISFFTALSVTTLLLHGPLSSENFRKTFSPFADAGSLALALVLAYHFARHKYICIDRYISKNIRRLFNLY